MNVNKYNKLLKELQDLVWDLEFYILRGTSEDISRVLEDIKYKAEESLESLQGDIYKVEKR